MPFRRLWPLALKQIMAAYNIKVVWSCKSVVAYRFAAEISATEIFYISSCSMHVDFCKPHVDGWDSSRGYCSKSDV